MTKKISKEIKEEKPVVKKVVKRKRLAPKPNVKAVRAPVKVVTSQDFIDEVIDVCEKQLDNVYIAFMDEDFALLVKKVTVSVNKIINPDAFQPYENNQQQFFHTAFIVEWGNPKSKKYEFEKLMKMDIPVNKITRTGSVFFIINGV